MERLGTSLLQETAWHLLNQSLGHSRCVNTSNKFDRACLHKRNASFCIPLQTPEGQVSVFAPLFNYISPRFWPAILDLLPS